MAAKFESIFSSSTAEVDPDLNKIFARKVKKEKLKKNEEIPNMDNIEDDDDERIPNNKPKKLSPETEKRTIFIGNLNTDCKKEVN